MMKNNEGEADIQMRNKRRKTTVSITPLLVLWLQGEGMLGLNFSDTTPMISETNKSTISLVVFC